MSTGRIAFGPYEFDCQSETLWRGRRLVALGGRAAALLRALLEADGAVTNKDVLLQAAWPGSIVEENNLPVQIKALRKVLGTRDDGSEWIVTVARAGYRLVPDTTRRQLPTIAVLPFVALDEVGSFADGFVEDLITALSRFRTFAVVARPAKEILQEHRGEIRQIGQALGVRYLIEGSVRRDGDRIRLTAQLIDGADGLHLWSEKLDGTLEGIFDLQDRLVAGVVTIFEPHLRRAEIERARRKRPENLNAYDFYLRALALIRGVRDFRVGDFTEAISLLDRAIELDPGFAPALSLCSGAHELRFTNGGVPPPGVDDVREALELAERALEADSSDAMVLVGAGAVQLVLGGDEARAFALLRQAEELNPNSTYIANVAAYCFWHAGHVEEAIERRMRALALAPGAPEAVWLMSGLATAHLSMGRMEEALHWGLRVLERTEVLDLPHCVVVAAYMHLGRRTEADARMRRLLALWPDLTIERLIGAKTAPKAHFMLLRQGLISAGMPVV
jgi:TolB-like protein/tetratricopeptide (TPR) repeat protein